MEVERRLHRHRHLHLRQQRRSCEERDGHRHQRCDHRGHLRVDRRSHLHRQGTFEGKEYTDTKTETLPATSHDTELVGAKDATCTEDGYTGNEVCKVCQTVVKQGEVIPALGHDYKDGKCSRCGAEELPLPWSPASPSSRRSPPRRIPPPPATAAT